MPIRSQMSLIMGQIEPECPELFALELGKIAEYDFVYTLQILTYHHAAPNLVKMYVIIRSRMSLIMDLIRSELSELSALEFENLKMSLIMDEIRPKLTELSALELENLPYLTLFTL